MTVNSMELESDTGSASCAVRIELRIYFVQAGPDKARGTPA